MPTSVAENPTTPVAAVSNREKWLVLAAAFFGWMFDGLEQAVFPLAGRPALQDLLKTTNDAIIGEYFGYITALFLIGAALGGFVFGWLGDRFGRVRTMTWSIVTYSIFTGLCYFATNTYQLGALRFISAIGMGGEWALGVALVMEFWPEKARPLLAGAIGSAANAGYALISVIGMFVKIQPTSWRWVMLAGAAPSLLSLFVVFFVPESRRWKAAVEKVEVHPVREVFSRQMIGRTLLGIAIAAVALIGTWGSVQWIPTWVHKMADATDPHAAATSLWFASIGAMIGCFAGGLLARAIGRRRTYFGLCLLSWMITTSLFWFFKSYSGLFAVMFGFVGLFTAAFYGWMPLYLPELFPTRMRATGQGVCYNFGRIFAAAGVLLQGKLVAAYDGSYPKAGATVVLVYFVGMVVIWFGPETKGKPLPD
jgi:SHS family sialic acid transporter-like MFS transporter